MSKEEAAEVLSIDGREVRVTHPDKLYFSQQMKLWKLDLVRYYFSVAPGAIAGCGRPDHFETFSHGAEPRRFTEAGALGSAFMDADSNALLSLGRTAESWWIMRAGLHGSPIWDVLSYIRMRYARLSRAP